MVNKLLAIPFYSIPQPDTDPAIKEPDPLICIF